MPVLPAPSWHQLLVGACLACNCAGTKGIGMYALGIFDPRRVARQIGPCVALQRALSERLDLERPVGLCGAASGTPGSKDLMSASDSHMNFSNSSSDILLNSSTWADSILPPRCAQAPYALSSALCAVLESEVLIRRCIGKSLDQSEARLADPPANAREEGILGRRSFDLRSSLSSRSRTMRTRHSLWLGDWPAPRNSIKPLIAQPKSGDELPPHWTLSGPSKRE